MHKRKKLKNLQKRITLCYDKKQGKSRPYYKYVYILR